MRKPQSVLACVAVVLGVAPGAFFASTSLLFAQSGTWTNTAGGSWPVTTNWFGSTVADGADNTADFSTLDLTADATVTLDGARTIGNLTFGDTTPSHNWILNTGTGGPLTLDVAAGSPLVTVNDQTATINAVLAGTDGLIKRGTGTLTLGGTTNNYTGNIVVSQGTLAANHASALGSTANSVTLGDASTGANPVTLRIDSGISGTVNVSSVATSNFGTSQTLVLNSGSALGANVNALTAAINLAGTVPLTIQATPGSPAHSTAQDWTGQIIGTGISTGTTALTLDGTSKALRLTFGGTSQTAANTFTGDVIIKGTVTTQNTTFGGAIAARQNLGFLNNNVNVNASTTWTLVWGGETVQALDGSGNISLSNQNALNNIGLTIGNNNTGGTYSGAISGSFGIAKVGSGTQVLSGASGYSGATAIRNGVLQLTSGSNRLPTGTTVTLGNLTDSGKLTLGNSSAAVNQTIAGLLTSGSGTANAVVGGNASTSILTINNATSNAYGGLLGGAGTNENNLAIIKSGVGTLTLTGLNTFTGNTASPDFTGVRITAGTVSTDKVALNNNPSGIGGGSASLGLNGGTFQYTGSGGTIERRIELGTTAGSAIDASGSGALVWNNTGGMGTAGVGGNRTLTLTGTSTANNTLNVALNSSVALAKSGTGTWVIGGANSYTLGTTINNGILALAASNDRLPTGTVLTIGDAVNNTSGTFKLDSRSQTLGGLQAAGTGTSNRVVNGNATAATLTINNSSNYSFAGILGGPGSNENNFLLTKQGTGTLTLTGNNTYSGLTTVSNGTLEFAHTGTSARANLTVGNTSSSTITPIATFTSGTTTFSGRIGLGGAAGSRGVISVSGSGTLTASGDFVMFGGNGTGSNTTGSGVIRQSGGTVNMNTSSGVLMAWAGNAYGAYQLSGGILNTSNVNDWNINNQNETYGIFSQSGGTVNMVKNLNINRQSNGAGVVDISGGTFNHTGTATFMNTGNGGTAVLGSLTVRGTGTLSSQTANFFVTNSTSTSTNGIVNLLTGGTIEANKIGEGGNTSGRSTFNFDGGTLKPYTTNAGTTFVQGLDNAIVHMNGAIIDTAGQNVTIGQTLVAPSGYGIGASGSTISVVSGGTGYIAPPVVKFAAPASGVEATGVAVIDSNGTVTDIIITSPGSGYTSGQSVAVTFNNGNNSANAATTVATGFNASASTLNTSGGLAKNAAGTLTLGGTNSYTGPTAINAGTLKAGSTQAFGVNSAVTLANVSGATLDITGFNNAIGSLAGGGLTGGNVTLGSATLTTGGNDTSTSFGGLISGAGGLTKVGTGTQTLTGNNSYGGATLVSTGTLLVNGSHSGVGGYSVVSGAILGGTGDTASALNISGTLSPGASIESFASGALTMNNGSTFIFEADPNNSNLADLMVVNGALSLTTTNLNLTSANLDSLSWAPNTKLTLISYTGTGITSGFNSYLDDTQYTFGPNKWLFNYNDAAKGSNFSSEANGAQFVTLTLVPVPEPASMVMIIFGGVFLFLFRGLRPVR